MRPAQRRRSALIPLAAPPAAPLLRQHRTPACGRRPQGILGLLGPQDRVAIVLFSDGACAPLPLTPVNCTDIPAIKQAVRGPPPWTEGLHAAVLVNNDRRE